jgi:hypothetical protein
MGEKILFKISGKDPKWNISKSYKGVGQVERVSKTKGVGLSKGLSIKALKTIV